MLAINLRVKKLEFQKSFESLRTSHIALEVQLGNLKNCDAPGLQPGLLTLMSRSTVLTLVKWRSTWAITSKTSPTSSNDPLWSISGQGLVKTLVKPLKHPLTFYVSRNFCTVLQISPKHFKISQCKSYVFCRGTQLSCWVAFLVWSVNWWKMQVNASRHYSLELRFLQSSTAFMQNPLIKTLYGLCKSCRGSADLQLCYLALGAL
jgi:hypothetical protein